MAAPMNQTAIKNWLRAVPLFSELSPEELDMVASSARAVTEKKNARVFEERDPADCCYVVTSGRARVVLSGWTDAEIVLGVVKPRSLVGEIALFNRSVRSATLVALEDCNFIRIPIASFEKLRKNARFEDRLMAHVVATLLQANTQMRVRSAASCMARVIACLVEIARQEGQRDGAGTVISRKKHQELADMTGCARETVSRKLETLEGEKLVSGDKTTMRLDIEGLLRYLRDDLGLEGPWA